MFSIDIVLYEHRVDYEILKKFYTDKTTRRGLSFVWNDHETNVKLILYWQPGSGSIDLLRVSGTNVLSYHYTIKRIFTTHCIYVRSETNLNVCLPLLCNMRMKKFPEIIYFFLLFYTFESRGLIICLIWNEIYVNLTRTTYKSTTLRCQKLEYTGTLTLYVFVSFYTIIIVKYYMAIGNIVIVFPETYGLYIITVCN